MSCLESSPPSSLIACAGTHVCPILSTFAENESVSYYARKHPLAVHSSRCLEGGFTVCQFRPNGRPTPNLEPKHSLVIVVRLDLEY